LPGVLLVVPFGTASKNDAILGCSARFYRDLKGDGEHVRVNRGKPLRDKLQHLLEPFFVVVFVSLPGEPCNIYHRFASICRHWMWQDLDHIELCVAHAVEKAKSARIERPCLLFQNIKLTRVFVHFDPSKSCPAGAGWMNAPR
jgi:hypothetical protein